jgi:hypothetical protein
MAAVAICDKRTKFRIRLEIARGLKTITLFHSYHEVDFAGNWLFGFGSLRISQRPPRKIRQQ